ncbi:MAG: PD-(D/E)XK nuclease family protein, partial [Chthoniobacterales bacterium]
MTDFRGNIAVIRHAKIGDGREHLLKWFSNAADQAWKMQKPFFVLVPEFSVSTWLKKLLLDEGQSVMGVQFITPRDAAYLLARHYCLEKKLCGSDDIDLLAGAVALEQSDPKSQAVGADPSMLRTLLETLAPTGCDVSEVLSRHGLKGIYQEFQKSLDAQQLLAGWQADREFLDRAKQSEAWIASLLVVGFHGGHWPLRHRIQSLIYGAEQSYVFLEEPRDEEHGGQMDRTWIDTWTEFSGKPEVLTEAQDKKAETFFAVGKNLHSQAQTIAALVAKWLEDGASRIGILIPQSGFLSDEIARAFDRYGFAYYDGLASLTPGETPDWRAWLEYQRNSTIGTLIAFLQARGINTAALERSLDKAWRNVLSDNLEVIQQWLIQRGEQQLGFPSILPETGTLANFLEQTEEIFQAMGWEGRALRVRTQGAIFHAPAKLKIDRASWCRWLQQTMESFSLNRSANAAEPYARVHLLRYETARSQEWSHLVFAGMNEGSEPGAQVAFPFLDADEATRLNAEIRKRNRGVVREGVHGTGSEILEEGYALCLGSEERRQIGRASLSSLFDSASHVRCFTASLHEESRMSLQLRPSNFFADVWMEMRKSVLSDDVFRTLADETDSWLSKFFIPPVASQVEAVARSQAARHDSTKSFGPYEFAFAAAPPKPAILSCDAWEKAYADPAPIWLRHYLGIQPMPDFENIPWTMVVGEWTHRWLDAIHSRSMLWETLPDSAQRLARIEAAASAFRANVTKVFAEAQRPMPFWWGAAFRQSLALARGLSAKLDGLPSGWSFAAEYPVSPHVSVSINDNRTLQLKGRMDMIVAENPKPDGNIDAAFAMVVDYKTGRSKPL